MLHVRPQVHDEREEAGDQSTTCAGRVSSDMAILRFESNLRKGETVALLDQRQMFGRHRSCTCVLNHPTVSREHFFIERTADKFFVVDNDSGNGTYVNGERVTWIELKEGDLIKSGPFRMRFELSTQERDTVPLDEEEAEPAREGRERGYPSEYLEGIRYFNAAKYFEAHEAWEEIWMRSSGDSRLFFQLLIQAAVCLHHYERGNLRGARGLYDRVLDKVARIPGVYFSLDVPRFAGEFKAFFAAVLDDDGFTDNETAQRPVIQLLADEFEEPDLSVAVEL